MTTPDLRERVAKAMNLSNPRDEIMRAADAAIAIVLEHAAKVAHAPVAMSDSADPYAKGYISACRDIAAAIRALKEKP